MWYNRSTLRTTIITTFFIIKYHLWECSFDYRSRDWKVLQNYTLYNEKAGVCNRRRIIGSYKQNDVQYYLVTLSCYIDWIIVMESESLNYNHCFLLAETYTKTFSFVIATGQLYGHMCTFLVTDFMEHSPFKTNTSVCYSRIYCLIYSLKHWMFDSEFMDVVERNVSLSSMKCREFLD